RRVIDTLVIFFNRLAQIVSILFGVQLGAGSATSAINSVADSTSKAGKAADSAIKSQGKLAKEMKKAGKEAKGALAPFDQLNVLQQQTADTLGGLSDGAGSGAGAGSGSDLPVLDTGGLSIPELDSSSIDTSLAELEEKVNKWKGMFLEFIQPVTDALGRLSESLKPLGQTIWEGLKWAWDNILVPLGEWTVTELLPTFLDLLAQAAETLNTALIALEPLGTWLWESFLKPLGEWTGDLIISALEYVTEGLKELNTWIQNNQDAFQVIVLIIGIFVAALLLILNPVWLIVAAILAVIAVIQNWGKISQWLTEVWKIGVHAMLGALIMFISEGLRRFLEFGQNLANWLRALRENFTQGLIDIRVAFQNAFVGI